MTTTLDLQPIDPGFLPTLEGVLAQEPATRQIAEAVVADNITDVFFVGVGGSYSSSIHAHELLARTATKINSFNLNAAEFNDSTPARVGSSSLVIASSHAGATPETVAAARLAKSLGARVVTLSREADTPLGRLADHALVYGSDKTITSAKQILLAQIAYNLLAATGEPGDHAGALAALKSLPEAILHALQTQEEDNASIASAIADGDPVWVVAAGGNLGAAYTMSVCHLVEMQWVPSAYFAAGDFFHGPFELLTKDAAFLLFCGEDATKGETDRVARFAQSYNAQPQIVDVAALELPGLPDEYRGPFSGIILGVFGGRLVDHLEAVRGHDMTQRRYMHRVEY